MSKKYARGGRRPSALRGKNKGRRKIIAVVGIVLCLALTGLTLTRWQTLRPAALTTMQPQANPTPQLSKEYIYAGGRLVAIEEPTASGGSGPAPTNLVAEYTSGTTVSLTWTAPAGSIQSYQVERSLSINGPFEPFTPNPAGTTFNDNTAESGKAYLYRVKALYTEAAPPTTVTKIWRRRSSSRISRSQPTSPRSWRAT